MLHLAAKAFWPAPIPFPVLHVDTGHNFPEVLAFRDETVERLGLRLEVASRAGLHRRRAAARARRRHPQPAADPAAARRDRRPPLRRRLRRRPPRRGEGPRQGADRQPARRVRPVGPAQPAPRAVEPLQRPRHRPGEHVRVFPISNWTELDVWRYIEREGIALPRLYYAHEREVFERDGMWLAVGPVSASRATARPSSTAPVRYRTVGDMSCTGRRRVADAAHRSPTSSSRSPPRPSPSAAPPAPTTASPRPPWRTARRRATSDEHRHRCPAPTRPRRCRRHPAPPRHRRLRRRRQVDPRRPAAARLQVGPRRPARRRRARLSRDRGLDGAPTSRCSPTACAPSASRASPSTSPTATSPRPSAPSSSPTAPGTCSTPATRSPARPPPMPSSLLVDARKGVLEQTRRHLAVAALLRVPHVVVAVNKIDLVDFDEDVFDRVAAEVQCRRRELGVRGRHAIPVSRPRRRQRRRPVRRTPWYDGPSLLELLEALPACGRPGARGVPAAGAARHPPAGRRSRLCPPRLPRVCRPGRLGCRARRRRGRRAALRAAHHRRRHRPRPAAARRGLRTPVGDAAARRRDRHLPGRPHRRGGGRSRRRPRTSRPSCAGSATPRCARASGCCSSTARARCSPAVRTIDGALDLDDLRPSPAESLALNDIGRVTFRLATPAAGREVLDLAPRRVPSCSSTPTTVAPSPPAWSARPCRPQPMLRPGPRARRSGRSERGPARRSSTSPAASSVVVGGGPATGRGVARLPRRGALVRVVAPWLCEELQDLVALGASRLERTRVRRSGRPRRRLARPRRHGRRRRRRPQCAPTPCPRGCGASTAAATRARGNPPGANAGEHP